MTVTEPAPATTALDTTTCGVVVRRSARVRQESRIRARTVLPAAADEINRRFPGTATVRLHQESAGARDRLHWVIALRCLADYDEVAALLDDAELADGPMLVDGSSEEIMLLPQSWGMYGTDEALPTGTEIDPAAAELLIPAARHQTSVPADELVTSATAGAIIHRVAQPKYAFRAEARVFARQITESINTRMQGFATSFLYEEAFGPADRTHWLIHMSSLNAYYNLIDMHMRMDPEVRDIYLNEIIAPEKGGGTWNRVFVEGSMRDVAFSPVH